MEFLLPVLRKKEILSRKALFGRAALVLTPLLGFALLSVFSALATDSATSFLSIQSRWGRSFSPWNFVTSFEMVVGYGGPPADLLGLVFALALIPIMWRRLPLSLALYGLAMVLMPLSTGSIMSMGRFMSVSIPHFLALALFLEKCPVLVRGGTVAGFAACQLLLANGLIAWYLVG